VAPTGTNGGLFSPGWWLQPGLKGLVRGAFSAPVRVF